MPEIDPPAGHLAQQESSWKRCCSIYDCIPSYSGFHVTATLGLEWNRQPGYLLDPPAGRYFEKWLMDGSSVPKLTHQ